MNLAHHVAAVAFVASLLAVSVLPAMSSPTHEPGTSAEGACAAYYHYGRFRQAAAS